MLLGLSRNLIHPLLVKYEHLRSMLLRVQSHPFLPYLIHLIHLALILVIFPT